jgi:hypothetical protein
MKAPIESAIPGPVITGRLGSADSSFVAMTLPTQLSAEALRPPYLDQVDTDMDGVAWLRGSATSTRQSPEPATGPGVDTGVYNSGCGGRLGLN